MKILALMLLLFAQHSEFTWTRLEYTGVHDDSYLKGWYTDSDEPSFEHNMCSMLARLTKIECKWSAVKPVKPNSKDMFDYPLVVMIEPEQATFSDADAANMSEWFKRGGFLVMEDFHGDEEFQQALAALRRVIPDATPIELNLNHPLFHIFLDIDQIVQAVNDNIAACAGECDQWENGPSGKDPKVFGVYNAQGDLIVVMNFNNDCGDGLQWINEKFYPVQASIFCTKLYANIAIWSLTH